MHRLLNTGHPEVVDADLSDYFGQIPHSDLLRSIARRVSDGRLLGWVKAWLEMAVEEDDGHYRRDTGQAYIGTRPSPASVQSICRRVGELTASRYGLLEPEVVVGRLNRLLTGWANYFTLGQVSPAYAAIDRHATRRLRQWLCRKHKVRSGQCVRFPDERLRIEYGLTHLGPRTAGLPWAKA